MNLVHPKIVVSFDFELGWGVLDSSLWKRREADSIYSNLRQVFDRLVAELRYTEISTTWAVVGSLLTESEAELDLEHLPVSYRDKVISFYRQSSQKTRCGLDLVDKLQKLDGISEIASHTQTHIYAEYPGVTCSQYVDDVTKSITTLEEFFGKQVKSLVFPRDQARYNNDVAIKHPLNFRLNPNYGQKNGHIYRMLKGAARLYSNAPKSRVIMGANGEYYQTGSLYFNWSGGKYEIIKKTLTKIQASRMVSSLREGDIYHVWLHPFNLAESNEHLNTFMEFIRELAELRDKGMVEVVTMDELVRDCQKEFSYDAQ